MNCSHQDRKKNVIVSSLTIQLRDGPIVTVCEHFRMNK